MVCSLIEKQMAQMLISSSKSIEVVGMGLTS